MVRSDNLIKFEQILKENNLMSDTGSIDYKAIRKATGIPDRTLRSWFSGEREPAPWVVTLLNYYFMTGGFR